LSSLDGVHHAFPSFTNRMTKTDIRMTAEKPKSRVQAIRDEIHMLKRARRKHELPRADIEAVVVSFPDEFFLRFPVFAPA